VFLLEEATTTTLPSSSSSSIQSSQITTNHHYYYSQISSLNYKPSQSQAFEEIQNDLNIIIVKSNYNSNSNSNSNSISSLLEEKALRPQSTARVLIKERKGAACFERAGVLRTSNSDNCQGNAALCLL
jgi:hypothetical protein